MSGRGSTTPPSRPDDHILRWAQMVEFAVEWATGSDWSKLIGCCTEAAMVGQRELIAANVAGVELVSGCYTGPVSESAVEYFGGNQHSWLEVQGWVIDPTRWVFRWESDGPGVWIGRAGFEYEPQVRTRGWQPHFDEWLDRLGWR